MEQVPDSPPQPGNAYPQWRQVVAWDEFGEQTTVPMPVPTPAAPTLTTAPVVPEPPSSVPGGTVAPPAPTAPPMR